MPVLRRLTWPANPLGSGAPIGWSPPKGAGAAHARHFCPRPGQSAGWGGRALGIAWHRPLAIAYQRNILLYNLFILYYIWVGGVGLKGLGYRASHIYKTTVL
jgi:hypothetical protein